MRVLEGKNYTSNVLYFSKVYIEHNYYIADVVVGEVATVRRRVSSSNLCLGGGSLPTIGVIRHMLVLEKVHYFQQ